MSKRIFVERFEHESCEDEYCICVHKDKSRPNVVDIYIHAKETSSKKTINVNKRNIFSKRVIEFLNADAYDFIKEVKKAGLLKL